jgi:hypothetical protein
MTADETTKPWEYPENSAEGPGGSGSGPSDQHEDEYDDEYGEQQPKGDPNAPVDDPRDDGYVDEDGNFDPTGNAGRGDDGPDYATAMTREVFDPSDHLQQAAAVTGEQRNLGPDAFKDVD